MRTSTRHLATFSLIAATLLFAATLPVRHTFWGGLVHAFAEAAMIGGLADWFAVVALFRHPLGLPIPHTAILPAHRARLTQGIIDIVQNTWLHKDAIRARIDRWDVGSTLAGWLASARARAAVGAAVRAVARELLAGLDAARLAPALRESLRARITSDDLARWLTTAGDRVLAERLHEPMLDTLLEGAARQLQTPDLVRTVSKMLREAADAYATSPMKKLGRWLAENAGALDYRDLAQALLGAAAHDIDAMRRDAAHPLRRAIDERLRELPAALAPSLHHALMTSPAVVEALEGAIERAAAWVRDDVERARDFSSPRSTPCSNRRVRDSPAMRLHARLSMHGSRSASCTSSTNITERSARWCARTSRSSTTPSSSRRSSPRSGRICSTSASTAPSWAASSACCCFCCRSRFRDRAMQRDLPHPRPAHVLCAPLDLGKTDA
jgi:uncharacterized membrane-anchored protein YjiN (DUF445 family)